MWVEHEEFDVNTHKRLWEQRSPASFRTQAMSQCHKTQLTKSKLMQLIVYVYIPRYIYNIIHTFTCTLRQNYAMFSLWHFLSIAKIRGGLSEANYRRGDFSCTYIRVCTCAYLPLRGQVMSGWKHACICMYVCTYMALFVEPLQDLHHDRACWEDINNKMRSFTTTLTSNYTYNVNM